MPKKSISKKSSSTKKAKHTSTYRADPLAIMRFVPWLFVAVLVLLVISMEVIYWPGELIVSFLPQIMILLAGSTMAYLVFLTRSVIIEGFSAYMARVGSHTYYAFAAIIVLGIYILVRSTHLVEPIKLVDKLRDPDKALTVATFNKLYVNTSFKKGSDFLVSEQADVISLQEIEFDEVVDISRKLGYEHYFVTECGCSAGDSDIAVVSKYPITSAQTIYEHRNSVVLRTVIDSEVHGQFVVFSLHMHVPSGPIEVALRRDVYDILSKAVLEEDVPVFVMGDFNTTTYSPQMADFAESVDSAIKNVVTRRWPQCSWDGTALGGAACLRIDYVFAPSNAIFKDFEVGKQSDSDHSPIIVELSF